MIGGLHMLGAISVGVDWKNVGKQTFGGVHTAGKGVLSVFGGGEIARKLEDLEAKKGILPDWAVSSKPAEQVASPPAQPAVPSIVEKPIPPTPTPPPTSPPPAAPVPDAAAIRAGGREPISRVVKVGLGVAGGALGALLLVAVVRRLL